MVGMVEACAKVSDIMIDYMHVREVKWSAWQQQTGARTKIHDVSNFSGFDSGENGILTRYKFRLQEGLGFTHTTGVLLESKPFF
jgi:hypothetical protein